MRREQPFLNPYLAGVGLGLVLLASFLLAGRGLGASGGAHRVAVTAASAVAPRHVAESEYLSRPGKDGKHPMDNWYVFALLGVLLGGSLSAYASGRLKLGIIKGPRLQSIAFRLAMAVSGGLLMGFAARFSRGCTSGQALSGGALMSLGSWVFMFSVFGGGYILAYFLRRRWI